MISEDTFINKKILIYGLGISGTSCLKYLSNKNTVLVYDDNLNLKNNENKNYFLNLKKISNFKFDYIVLSPGIDINQCKLKNY